MKIIIALTILLYVVEVRSFAAYDCSSPTSLGLFTIDTHTCDDQFQEQETKEVNKVGTLVQVPKYLAKTGKILSVSKKTLSLYCSYFRLSTLKLDALSLSDFYPHKISAPHARLALSTMQLRLSYVDVTLLMNEEITILDTDMADVEGYCKVGRTDFSVNVYRISLQEIVLKFHLNSRGEVEIITAFGETLNNASPVGDGYLEDGEFVSWNPSDILACTFEKVYAGHYQVITDVRNKSLALFSELGVGLGLKNVANLCNTNALATNNEYLYILEGTHNITNSLKPTAYASWSSLVLSAANYLEGKHMKVFKNTTNEIIYNICKLEDTIRKDIVYGAKTEPAMVAYRLTGIKGTIVSVAGAVIQVLKCKPMQVKLRNEDHCFVDIPIEEIESNSTRKRLFMDPVTNVVTISTSRLPCNDPTNPFFVIRSKFYKRTPSLQNFPRPETLPSNLRNVVTKEFQIIRGLYSHELVAKAETQWTFEESRRRAVNNLINIVDPKIGDAGSVKIKKIFHDDHLVTSIPDQVHMLFKSLIILNLIFTAFLATMTYKLYNKGKGRDANNESNTSVNINLNAEATPLRESEGQF